MNFCTASVLVAVFAATVVGCGGDDGGGDPSLTGVAWEWQASSYSNDTTAAPDDSSRYTVEFMDDGSLAIKADCNDVGGSYTDDGSALTIRLGASTRAACPSDSLDTEFLRDLAAASTYALASDSLRIDLKLDSGSMQLAPAP